MCGNIGIFKLQETSKQERGSSEEAEQFHTPVTPMWAT